MSDTISSATSCNSQDNQGHDAGIENGDTFEMTFLGYLEAEPRVKAVVRAVLADRNLWSALDHENYNGDYVRQENRTGRGQYVLESVLEFLMEEQGYTLHDAKDALVLEAVRVACNASADANRARRTGK